MSDTLLIVADEPRNAAALLEALAAPGRELVRAREPGEALRLFKGSPAALVVVDWSGPGAKVRELCSRLRALPGHGAVPILLLVDKSRPDAVEKGFAAKADACLERPVEARRLQLWAEALLRRVRREDEHGRVLRADGFVVDPVSRTVTADGIVVRGLTEKEFSLLYALVRRRPHVVSKEFILGSVWRAVRRDNTVEAHVKNLRAKLGPAAARIVTVPNAGYRFQ